MKRLFKKWFSPGIDIALRYLPVTDVIRSDRMARPRILDVGSGTKGGVKYLGYPVIGLDREFVGDIAEGLTPVRGDGLQLPFKDKSFDYVLSVDNLEHIPPDLRPLLIGEIMRVAKRRVFLTIPCGAFAEEQDRRLDRLYLRTHGERFPFFCEHVNYGLPEENEILELLQRSGREKNIVIRSLSVIPNVNIVIREVYMRLWISRWLALLYHPLVFFSFLRGWLNFGSCYRNLFVVDVEERGVIR